MILIVPAESPEPAGVRVHYPVGAGADVLARRYEELVSSVRPRRHEPVREQHAWLSSVLHGHYRYYVVPTNSAVLHQFQTEGVCSNAPHGECIPPP